MLPSSLVLLLDSVPGGNGYLPSYPDIVAACIAQLRVTTSVVTAFGDNPATANANKFWADKAMGQPTLPYLVFGEPESQREWMSGGNFIDRGQLTASVFSAGKLNARQLADAVGVALNDAPMLIDGMILMKFRYKGSQFVPIGDVSPGEPTAYQRVLIFDYWLAGVE